MNYDSLRRNEVAKETHIVCIDTVQPQIDLSILKFAFHNATLISINILMSPSVPSVIAL